MNDTNIPVIGTPAAEYVIDPAFVSAMVADQHPDLAHLPVLAVDAGWDNALFRLGDDFAVRFPRRAAAAPLIVHEQTWLPRLADQLSLPVPVPYRVGLPGNGYPWRWSIVPWIVGTAADQHPPDPSEARSFAAFLRSLHVLAPSDAPLNPVRGGPLHERASFVVERMRRLSAKTDLITPQVEYIWQTALSAPIDVAQTWLHGDLHPRNVLVDGGVITGIIDWGDITAGDCATDLASVWMLFTDATARRAVFDAYAPVSQATLHRAKGWAVAFGVMLLDSGLVDNPRHATIGERVLRRLVEPI